MEQVALFETTDKGGKDWDDKVKRVEEATDGEINLGRCGAVVSTATDSVYISNRFVVVEFRADIGFGKAAVVVLRWTSPHELQRVMIWAGRIQALQSELEILETEVPDPLTDAQENACKLMGLI